MIIDSEDTREMRGLKKRSLLQKLVNKALSGYYGGNYVRGKKIWVSPSLNHV